MKAKKLLISEIKNCARCNKSHTGLEFKKLSRSDLYFSNCPNTNEPILLRINNINHAKQINENNKKGS